MLGICNKNNPVPSGENRYIQFSNASWKSYLLKRHFRICYSIVQSHLLFFIFYNLLNTLLFYYKCKLSSFYSCQKNGSFNPLFPCFHPLYHFLTFLSLGHPTILFPSFLKARSSLYTPFSQYIDCGHTPKLLLLHSSPWITFPMFPLLQMYQSWLLLISPSHGSEKDCLLFKEKIPVLPCVTLVPEFPTCWWLHGLLFSLYQVLHSHPQFRLHARAFLWLLIPKLLLQFSQLLISICTAILRSNIHVYISKCFSLKI